MDQRPQKLLDQGREAIRLTHDSIRTEASSVTGIQRSILFHNTRPPNAMGRVAIEAFRTHLAGDQQGAASTPNQALSALLFRYRDVLHTPLDLSIDALRAKNPERMPTVLTTDEPLTVIERLSGPRRFMAKLLSGGGLRLMECLRLRVKDPDLAQRQLIVRDGKGTDHRVTMLPERLIIPLQEQ